MTDHPAIAAGCSAKQIEAFEAIAVGQTGGHGPATLKALEKRGLIDFINHENRRFKWREPFVPLDLHAQWCEWCDENVTDDGELK